MDSDTILFRGRELRTGNVVSSMNGRILVMIDNIRGYFEARVVKIVSQTDISVLIIDLEHNTEECVLKGKVHFMTPTKYSWLAARGIRSGIDNKIKEEKEEAKMPDNIIIIKNTEVFKKGGVFSRGASEYSDYSPENNNCYHTPQTCEGSITGKQVQILLDKKVAVEAVKFSPEYVTLEQNEALQKVLAAPKRVAKKTPVKKVVKKTTKKVTK